MLLSAMPVLLYLGLTVYCLIECLQSPAAEVRLVRRSQWVALIVLLPLAGALSWVFAGRPRRGRHERSPAGPNRADGYGWTAEGVARHPVGPDDDPEFLAGLSRAQRRRDGQDPKD